MSRHNPYLQQIKDVPQLQPYIKKSVVSTRRQLGKGAFGYVVEVQLHGGALCAGKKIHDAFLDPHNEGVEYIVRRFITECELMSKMHHPNIVHFYGLAFLDDSYSPVLVMELLDRSLDDYLEKTKPADVLLKTRISILHDIAKGLVFLHSYKPPIIHRDLTARNILLTKMKQARIADLGNSRIINKEALSRNLSQTPGTFVYMPPEATESPVMYDTSLDIFSFGHLALYGLGNRFPYPLLRPNYIDPKSHAANKLCARTEVERRIEYFKDLYSNPEIPSQVTEMVESCLDNMPEHRPAATTISALLGHHEELAEKQYKQNRVAIVEPAPTLERRHSNPTTKIKNGARFLMEREVCRPKKKPQCKTCIIQLEEGKLSYQKLNEKKTQELELKYITAVESILNEPGQFRFTIHIEQKKEKQTWHLKVDTEEERDGWVMVLKEAIAPSPAEPHMTDLESQQSAVQYDYVLMRPAVRLPDNEKEKQVRPTQGDRHFTTPAADLQQEKPTLSRGAVSLYGKPGEESQMKLSRNPSYLPGMQNTLGQTLPQERSVKQVSFADSPGRAKIQQKSYARDDPPKSSADIYEDIMPVKPAEEKNFYVDPDEIAISLANDPNVGTYRETIPIKPEKQFYVNLEEISPSTHRPRSQAVSGDTNKPNGLLGNAGPRQLQVTGNRLARPLSSDFKYSRTQPRGERRGRSASPTFKQQREDKQQGFQPKQMEELLGTLYIPADNLLGSELIAQGEFGDIYHSRLRNLTGEIVDVAVKTLQTYEDLENFEREMAMSADPLMNHPNIVKVYGLVKGADQIVMEYLPFGDLKTFLSTKSLGIEWLTKYMLDIANGMTFISERGLIHRDLAARNVLMASNGEVCKVSDFGLLRKLPTDETYYFQTSIDKCPIRWMAPESIEYNKFSAASDVWSYGIVLWEMLNPKMVPFEKHSNLQVAVKITQGVLLDIPTNCPEHVGQIIESCWNKRSSDRPKFREIAHKLYYTTRH